MVNESSYSRTLLRLWFDMVYFCVFPTQTFLRASDDAVRSHVLSSVSGEVFGPQPQVSTL